MIDAAWPALMVNFVFWSGIAIGAPVFVATLDLTHAKWSEPLRDVALRFCRFLPPAFIIYLVMFGAVHRIHTRDAVAFAAAFGVAFAFGRRRHRPGTETAITLLIVYAAAFSVIAVDLIMSLEPDWVSTLFPAYILTTNIYAAIAALTVTAAISMPANRLSRSVMCDLGAVLLGFAFIWIYFTWTQFLVIWYGNLPIETRYIAERISGGWQWMAWMVAAACGAFPTLVLMPQLGRNRIPLAIAAVSILIGYWAECWLLIVPAFKRAPPLPTTFVITAAFGLLFAACIGLPQRLLSPTIPPPRAEAHAVRSNR